MNEEPEWHEISEPTRLPAQPVVSVHMLAYNHGPYLADAIEGVLLQQTDFPIELIIGEDCSSDNTLDLATAYQRRHPGLIRLIASKRNVGMHANYRRVLDACRGEYVAFCEGDDYWHHPGKLQMQRDFLRDHPACGFVHSDYDYRVRQLVRRRIWSHGDQRPPQGKAFEQLLAGYSLATTTVVYRRKLLQDVEAASRGLNAYRFVDYSRALMVSRTHELGYQPVSTATYRYMPGSAMNAGPTQSLALRRSVIECRRQFCETYSVELPSLAAIERQEYRLLYGSAYLARKADTFVESGRWLGARGDALTAGWRHHVRRIILAVAPLHAVVAWRARRQWLRSIDRNSVPMTIDEQRRASLAES
jgi:glycosyltransferase involved in cell wall biosynthesis